MQRRGKVSVKAPGRIAKQARDELALNNESIQQQAELCSDNREVADLPKHKMSADQNAKLKQLIQCSLPSPVTFFLLID